MLQADSESLSAVINDDLLNRTTTNRNYSSESNYQSVDDTFSLLHKEILQKNESAKRKKKTKTVVDG